MDRRRDISFYWDLSKLPTPVKWIGDVTLKQIEIQRSFNPASRTRGCHLSLFLDLRELKADTTYFLNLIDSIRSMLSDYLRATKNHHLYSDRIGAENDQAHPIIFTDLFMPPKTNFDKFVMVIYQDLIKTFGLPSVLLEVKAEVYIQEFVLRQGQWRFYAYDWNERFQQWLKKHSSFPKES